MAFTVSIPSGGLSNVVCRCAFSQPVHCPLQELEQATYLRQNADAKVHAAYTRWAGELQWVACCLRPHPRLVVIHDVRFVLPVVLAEFRRV